MAQYYKDVKDKNYYFKVLRNVNQLNKDVLKLNYFQNIPITTCPPSSQFSLIGGSFLNVRAASVPSCGIITS